ncbi:MAG: OmpA family protein [Rhodospirillales bacterium]|nr:OmpA family protein [Rhodospirillales bacterium]
MRTSSIAFTMTAALAASILVVSSGGAQTTPTEQDIIDALQKPGGTGEFTNVRSLSGDRGVTVTGGEKTVPSIDLKVTFAFGSARLDNESLLTLDVLGRALSSEELKGQAIEIVGHTDAKGTLEYNDTLSQRRAAAVVTYIVRNFTLDPALMSSKGMGERQLLDKDNPEAGINRRVEIRNVTRPR